MPECWRTLRLRCVSDVIHWNNVDQESWVTEAVCRRLGYTGLNADHEKAVRNFMNGWRAWQPTVESLNGSEIAPESLNMNEFSFQDLWVEPPRKTIFATKCLRMALSCATVVPHFTWCHILHSYERSISFWNCREWKQNRPESGSPSLVSFPDHFSPNREKLGLGLGKVDCWAYGYLNW